MLLFLLQLGHFRGLGHVCWTVFPLGGVVVVTARTRLYVILYPFEAQWVLQFALGQKGPRRCRVLLDDSLEQLFCLLGRLGSLLTILNLCIGSEAPRVV